MDSPSQSQPRHLECLQNQAMLTLQVASYFGDAVVVEQQDLEPWQAWEALQAHDGIV